MKRLVFLLTFVIAAAALLNVLTDVSGTRPAILASRVAPAVRHLVAAVPTDRSTLDRQSDRASPVIVAHPTPTRRASKPAQHRSLAQIVDTGIAGKQGTWGVAVRNLKTGEQVLINGNRFFPSASLYKLGVLYEVFRDQQAGTLSLDETLTVQPGDLAEADGGDPFAAGDEITVRQALGLMIDASDNVAAYVLARRVGWARINQTMAELGLDQTRVPAGAWETQVDDWRKDFSTTSPSDMLTFLDRLYHRQLISTSASDQMLDLLLRQGINDRLPADLPPGTRVAHKTGNLDGVVNDAGIIYTPRADLVVVFLAQDTDVDTATMLEASLARAIYDYFNAS